MYFKILAFSVFFITIDLSANEQHLHQHQHQHSQTSPLKEPGNAGFATIQEAVRQLLQDPATDWSKVNLEALRQHLVDMQNFTYHVEVMDQKAVSGGVMFKVKPKNGEAAGSLQRMFSAHPAILKQETGWDMKVEKNKDGSFSARVTGPKKTDVAKIRGLGYIGLIAYGNHHQAHHWQMAKGSDPHR